MKTILVPVDFSDATDPVLQAASSLAGAFHAKIVLVNVFQPAAIPNEFSPLLEDYAVAEENGATEQLSHLRQGLRNDGLVAEANILYGPTAASIRTEAQRLAADYIVVGSHGHGALFGAFIGSTASQLLKKAPCPVLVVPVKVPKAATNDSTSEAKTA
jgi:nucleotide-binding universal stress UspA family protein